MGRVGRVVDVVLADVGQVGVGGVLLDVELVDEVEEDGVLLVGRDGLAGAVGASGDAVVGGFGVGGGSGVVVSGPRGGVGEEGDDQAGDGSKECETHFGGWW